MVGFWITAGAMGALVALVLIQALRQARPLGPAGAEDLVLYRDQLAEVDRDLSRRVIEPAEANRLRTEVQRRMLEADRAGRLAAPASATDPALLAAVIILALGGAVFLYGTLGVPGYPDLPLSNRLAAADQAYSSRPHQDALEAGQSAAPPPAAASQDDLALMEKLRAAVAARPDDLQGHILLADREAKLGNLAAARKAYEVVIRLKGASVTAEDYGTLAEMMIAAAGNVISPEAEAALVEIAKRNPQDGPARFYLGLMAAQVGRPDRAFAMWKPLLDEGPQDAPWIAPIRQMMQQVADAAGIAYAPPAAAAPDTAGPDAAAVAKAAQMAPADRQKMIEGMVGGLEARLMANGGPVADWTKLINALGVLSKTDPKAKFRAGAAYLKAQAEYVGQPGELSALKAAAVQAGVVQTGVVETGVVETGVAP